MGDDHTCVIMDNDQLLCFGNGNKGRLGTLSNDIVGDDPSRPLTGGLVQLPTGRTAKFVLAGYTHTCVIMDNDQLLCFGWGRFTVLVTLSIANVGDDPSRPLTGGLVQLPTGRTAKSVPAADRHTCVIMDNDQLLYFGDDSLGRLGTLSIANVGDDPSRPLSGGIVQLPTGRTAKSVSAGGGHTCVIMDDDQPLCFGLGHKGQLGSESTANVGDDPASPLINGLVKLPVAPSPTPSSTITATPTSSVSPTPTTSMSSTPTASVSPTPSPSGTPTSSASPTPSTSGTPTSSASPTPSTSGTPTSSASPTPSPTGSPSVSPSHTAAPPDDAAGAAGTAADATDDGDATRPILYTAVALLAVVVLAGIGFALYRRRADKAAAVGVAPVGTAGGAVTHVRSAQP